MRNRRKIPLGRRDAVEKIRRRAVVSENPNGYIGVDDQRRYAGLRIFFSQAWTSFISSRSAQIPTEGCSATRTACGRFKAVSLATGLPRRVTVALPTFWTFFSMAEVLSRSSLAVTVTEYLDMAEYTLASVHSAGTRVNPLPPQPPAGVGNAGRQAAKPSEYTVTSPV